MADDWKPIVPRQKGAPVELYQSADELSEKKHLAEKEPKKIAKPQKRLTQQQKRDPRK